MTITTKFQPGDTTILGKVFSVDINVHARGGVAIRYWISGKARFYQESELIDHRVEVAA